MRAFAHGKDVGCKCNEGLGLEARNLKPVSQPGQSF